MSAAYWRSQSLKAIEKTISRVGTSDLKTLRHEISKAYPFGQREHYPYKIWLESVKGVMSALETQAVPVENQIPPSTEAQPSLFGVQE